MQFGVMQFSGMQIASSKMQRDIMQRDMMRVFSHCFRYVSELLDHFVFTALLHEFSCDDQQFLVRSMCDGFWLCDQLCGAIGLRLSAGYANFGCCLFSAQSYLLALIHVAKNLPTLCLSFGRLGVTSVRCREFNAAFPQFARLMSSTANY